ncbi:MAG: AbrB/MazE/SpoVT family DNA-binding domain-containing protein [Actinobacteria bacterium]|nr:AbrB/MazE/SpoVT family DNA-binding domain-containing protein [Actinomycetota bacterium]
MKGIRVSAKGQIVIPKEIRDKLGIKPGDKVDFVNYAGTVIVLKSLTDPIRETRGMLKGGPSMTEALLRDRREECEREEREMEEDRRCRQTTLASGRERKPASAEAINEPAGDYEAELPPVEGLSKDRREDAEHDK